MEVKTKFNVGDMVWYIYNNKVSHLDVTAVSISVYSDSDPIIKYTLHYDYELDESKLFTTKEELLKSLW